MVKLPSPPELVDMDESELAYLVLADVPDVNEHGFSGGPFGIGSYIGGLRGQTFGRSHYDTSSEQRAWLTNPGEARWEQALTSAFGCLHREGLVTRDATQDSANWIVRTARGSEIAKDPSARQRLDASKLLALRMNERLEPKVRQRFASGDLDEALFAAFRAVEIAVRDAVGADREDLGVKLMTRAFKPDEGPLHDPSITTAEQVGVMALYQGAIAVFKNPSSHHLVDFDDPAEAAEAILFADLLLRMLDRRQRAVA